jgi:hypothetical protein
MNLLGCLLLLCFTTNALSETKGLGILLKKYKPKIVIEVGSDRESVSSGKVYLAHSPQEYPKGVRADLIYLHAAPVAEDLNDWYLLARGRGILCGTPISPAVHQFAADRGLSVKVIGEFWYYEEPISEPIPLGFSIPACKIVPEIPLKQQDFAVSIPGQLSTYVFEEEADYYKDYQRSYFAVTCRKGGWDCLRHYEILANGCIPYFLDLDSCDLNTLYFLPKELIKEAMNLPGVSYLEIDHDQFDISKYQEILTKILEHTREFLTTSQMARYLLKTLHFSGTGKVLFLADPGFDYLQCLTAIGLKEVLGENLVDIPKLSPIYNSYLGNVLDLYGKGMTYTKIIDDLPTDRENIEQRIGAQEFELIIYSSIHRSLPFYDLVLRTYSPEKIAYLCGEDWHTCGFAHLKNFFIREYDAAFPLLRAFPDPDQPEIRPIGNPW